MDLEIEIPIWYDGRVKWISNLTSRSTCLDVIQAILLSLNNCSTETNENYTLYECWRGIERPLKGRCRLLKLWKSWAGESQNVVLTLRSRQKQTVPMHILIRQQEDKLNKLKRQLKRTNRQIEKLNISNRLNEDESENDKLLNYLNIYRSIIRLNVEIENQQEIILHLTNEIANENQQNLYENDFKNLLYDVNETLISSRKLTELSDEFDQQINKANQDVDQKQILLDELELDCALQENIDIDSLNDSYDEQFSFNQISSSPPPTIPMKISTVQNRPTAIVEPNLSTSKSNEFLCKNKTHPSSLKTFQIEEKLPTNTMMNSSSFPIRYGYYCESSTIVQSDLGISSIHSNDQQLVTLV